MRTSLSVREASAEDIPVIQQLAQETWPTAYGQLLSPGQLAYMLNMMYSTESLRKQMADGHRFYIAETGEKILGFASVSDEGEHTFKLNKLYILPNIQRSGAGSALLDTCISFAKEHQGRRLILQVNRQNPARHFYEKHGFSILEEIDLHVGNGFYMNDYVMELLITN